MPVDALLLVFALELSASDTPPPRTSRTATRSTRRVPASGGDWQLLEFLGGWEGKVEPHMLDEAAGAPIATGAPPAKTKETTP